jgi:hypothetical protein
MSSLEEKAKPISPGQVLDTSPLAEATTAPTIGDMNPMLVREVAEGLSDITSYESKVGWKFGNNSGCGHASVVRQYAELVVECLANQGSIKRETLDRIHTLIAEDPNTAVARTIAMAPLTFNELSQAQCDRLDKYVHLAYKNAGLGDKGASKFGDSINTAIESDHKIEILGHRMTMVLHYSGEVPPGVNMDFVPTSSLRATHAFQASLSQELTSDDKLQAKLDLTNSLIVLSQSAHLATQSCQLIEIADRPGDSSTLVFKPIQRIETLSTNKTNESFANYLKNKFGFEVEQNRYGFRASISGEGLRNLLPRLLEARSDYIGRMLEQE